MLIFYVMGAIFTLAFLAGTDEIAERNKIERLNWWSQLLSAILWPAFWGYMMSDFIAHHLGKFISEGDND
jgi:purine-cytosine permease-like protein